MTAVGESRLPSHADDMSSSVAPKETIQISLGFSEVPRDAATYLVWAHATDAAIGQDDEVDGDHRSSAVSVPFGIVVLTRREFFIVPCEASRSPFVVSSSRYRHFFSAVPSAITVTLLFYRCVTRSPKVFIRAFYLYV